MVLEIIDTILGVIIAVFLLRAFADGFRGRYIGSVFFSIYALIAIALLYFEPYALK